MSNESISSFSDQSNRVELRGVELECVEPETVGLSSQRLARIEPIIQQYIDKPGKCQIPGALTLIARNGQLAYLNAQGFADVDEKQAIQPDTLFRIYSMTKPITAVAVMILYEQGKFFLDDPIGHFLPELKNMTVHTENGLVEANGPISIRHLLTHTAGFTYSMVPDVPAVSSQYEEAGLNEAMGRLSGYKLKQYVETLAELPLISHPGTEWHYSEGMCVLARLVEVLAGQSYGEFLRSHVFEPLGMVDTDYHVPEEKSHRLAVLYKQCPDKQGFLPTEGYGGDYTQRPPLEPGGSGLVSTAQDYFRFAQMLLNRGELEGNRLLSPTSTRLILADHSGGDFGKQLPASVLPAFKGLGFGFGAYVVTDAISRGSSGSDGEYGWGGWASTSFWIDPKEQLMGLVFTQLIPQANVTLGLAEKFHQMAYQAVISTQD